MPDDDLVHESGQSPLTTHDLTTSSRIEWNRRPHEVGASRILKHEVRDRVAHIDARLGKVIYRVGCQCLRKDVRARVLREICRKTPTGALPFLGCGTKVRFNLHATLCQVFAGCRERRREAGPHFGVLCGHFNHTCHASPFSGRCRRPIIFGGTNACSQLVRLANTRR